MLPLTHSESETSFCLSTEPGAIEKLAMEDPRRARTGQVLEDRIAAKRSELRKGKKKAKAKADAAAEAQQVAEGGAAATASSGLDKMDEDDEEGDEAASANGDDDAGSKEGAGVEEEEEEEESDDDGSGGDEEQEEGLEEDNLRELLAGSRGKVRLELGQYEDLPPRVMMDIVVRRSGTVSLCLRTAPAYYSKFDRVCVWGSASLCT